MTALAFRLSRLHHPAASYKGKIVCHRINRGFLRALADEIFQIQGLLDPPWQLCLTSGGLLRNTAGGTGHLRRFTKRPTPDRHLAPQTRLLVNSGLASHHYDCPTACPSLVCPFPTRVLGYVPNKTCFALNAYA